MKNKSRLNKISIVIIFTFLMQLLAVNIVAAYPSTNINGKPLNQAMSDKAGFGIYGLEDNGTGIKTGVIPTGMTVPQEQKSGEWRYLGYNFDDKVISNPSFPGDYSGPGGTKIGGKAYTWSGIGVNDYNRVTPATNADSGDSQSANQIGIDYCELLKTASSTEAGAFRVWFKIPPYPGYPNGRTMYMTYIIPKNDIINRFSFIYFREEGTQNSLLANGALYEKNTFPLRPGTTVPITATSRTFEGYEFTRSVTSTSTSGGFANELTGEPGKTRSGSVSYNSSNEFDVIFYYKKVADSKKLNIKHVSYDPVTKTESIFDEYSIDINKKEAYADAAREYPGYKYLQYQASSSGYSSGTTSTDTDFSFTYNDFGSSNEYYVKFMYVKDLNAAITGQIITDKSSYTCTDKDTSIIIQAKDQTDINVQNAADVQEIGAKVTSYSLNGGSETTINKINTGSGIKTISTDYAALNIDTSLLNEGSNTLTINGYSWFKDKLGNLKEVNTSKTVTIEKTKEVKTNNPPTVILNVPPTVYLGDDVYVSGSGQDPDGDPLDYYWDKPNDMYGTLEGKNGTVYFMNLGIKTFGLTVADPSGESASATAQTNVIAPYPQINIQTKGTLKENRKVILDATSSTGGSKRIGVDWTKAKWEVSAVSGGTAADIKTASNYNGSQTMDFVFKKPGTYKAKLTLTNTLGLSSTQEKTFVIEVDKTPISDFSMPKNILRDPNDLSSGGLAQGTFQITDLSKSEDGDTIAKRAYFVTFDSDNDGDWDEEMCYVYDLDSTLTKQMPNNDSDNLHWRPMGLYKDFPTFDITNINTGNFTEMSFKTTHVGKTMFDLIVKEEYGQPTIEQFVTPADRKTGTTYE